MSKIITCIDGSTHADSVCNLSAWAAKSTKLPISLLHVVTPHSDVATKGNFSGSIGLGAKRDLLEELTEIDEARGKLEQRKGLLMLDHAVEELAAKGIENVKTLHLRGSLVDTIIDLESQAELVILGKYGEHADGEPSIIGSHLESVARSIKKPLLIATKNTQKIEKFLIAFDGSATAKKALEQVSKSKFLKDLECHLLTVGENNAENNLILQQAKTTLENAGYQVTTSLQTGNSVEDVVSNYVEKNAINLLAIGAYGHSKIRSMILGSVTTSLIHKSKVPVLLFR